MVGLSCTICYEIYKNTDEVHSTSCGHIYHAHCVQEWQTRSSYCPQCRFYNPTTHKIYLPFDNMQTVEEKQTLAVVNLKLEQSVMKAGELEQQLKESELNFLDLQGQYNQNENELKKLKAKIDYLTLQNDSREYELTQKAIENERLRQDLTRLRNADRKLQKKINDLENLVKDFSLELQREMQWSAELQTRMGQGNSRASQTISNRISSDARSLVVKGLTYTGRQMNFVQEVIQLGQRIGLDYRDADFERVYKLNYRYYRRNTISLVVVFRSVLLMRQYFENREALKLFYETERVAICQYISRVPN